MAQKSTRQSFGETISQIGQTNPRVVVMDADLGKSTMTAEFMKKFPDRYFEMGIAEQNLISTAAGLSLGGKIPFAASFACFLTGRYEPIRMSVCYSNANVKLVGTHAGVGIGEDGYSQMGLEDIAVLRSLPNLVILQPADDLETQAAVRWASEYQGPVYLRLTRQKVQDVHSAGYQFQMGKGDVLKKAKSSESVVTVFATGGVVYNALKAVEDLETQGLNINLINIHTIQPLDRDLVLSFARESKKIVAIEDHSQTGGLGSAVSEVIADHAVPVKVIRHGTTTYGFSGAPEELYESFGFSIPKIKEVILKN